EQHLLQPAALLERARELERDGYLVGQRDQRIGVFEIETLHTLAALEVDRPHDAVAEPERERDGDRVLGNWRRAHGTGGRGPRGLPSQTAERRCLSLAGLVDELVAVRVRMGPFLAAPGSTGDEARDVAAFGSEHQYASLGGRGLQQLVEHAPRQLRERVLCAERSEDL